ncbi:hypothetical protein M2322_004590 [Rhodoblastus acidophilus]|uniref:hypothetical protein n=1 Tax=Rhodoblastus acidophilus TaxID=1074 RepID=UPI00222413D3|nr:hypothetical protein [Rhodoblastus acidophilus]MCW2319021.1 hypothetical protein [Rhodoblastus acidophilus]
MFPNGHHTEIPTVSRGKVKDTRAAVIEQARETRVVLPEAHFAVSAEGVAAFTRCYAYCAAEDQEGDETSSDEGEPTDASGGDSENPASANDDDQADGEDDETHAAAA